MRIVTVFECCALALLLCLAGCTVGDIPTDGDSATNLDRSSASTPSSPVDTADTSDTQLPHWAGQRLDEPFDVMEYLVSRATPRDNAAPLYLAVLTPICTYLSGNDDSPFEEEIAELAKIERLVDGTITLQRIEDVLLRAAPVLERIDAAQTTPTCVFVTGLSVDSVMPHALAVQTVSRLSILGLKQAQKGGDFKQVEAAIARSLRALRDLQPRGHEVCQLVSMSMDGRILEGIERLTLADSQLTVQHLDRLMTLLKTHKQQMLNRIDEGLKVHYIVSRNSIEDLRSGRLTIDDIVDYQTPFESASGSAEQSGDSGLPGPPQFNWEAEIAACNRLFRQAIIAATQLTYYPDSFGDFRQELERCQSEIDRFTELVTSTPVSERARLRDRAPSFLHGLWVAPVEPLVECSSAAPPNSLAPRLCLSCDVMS